MGYDLKGMDHSSDIYQIHNNEENIEYYFV